MFLSLLFLEKRKQKSNDIKRFGRFCRTNHRYGTKPAPASSHIARHIVHPPASTNAAPAVFKVLIKSYRKLLNLSYLAPEREPDQTRGAAPLCVLTDRLVLTFLLLFVLRQKVNRKNATLSPLSNFYPRSILSCEL